MIRFIGEEGIAQGSEEKQHLELDVEYKQEGSEREEREAGAQACKENTT